MSRMGDESFDGSEESSYLIAADSVQMKTRDVSVRRSGAGERRIGFVVSRDYPFLGWGPHPHSRISPPLLLLLLQNPGISRTNEGRPDRRHILTPVSLACPFPASSTDNSILHARIQYLLLVQVSRFTSHRDLPQGNAKITPILAYEGF